MGEIEVHVLTPTKTINKSIKTHSLTSCLLAGLSSPSEPVPRHLENPVLVAHP